MIVELVAACAFAATIASASQNPFPNLVPAALKISYAHDMGSIDEIELKDRKVIYHVRSIGDAGFSGFVEPTLEQWSKFIAALNAAKVYKWEQHYKGVRMADDGGYYWSIELQLGERHFTSDGNSGVPTDGDIKSAGDSRLHISYDQFNKAVAQLIGHDFP